MSDISAVVLIGRLVRDADLKHAANGTPVSKFSLAVNEWRKAGGEWKDEASFFEIVLWGQLGESLNQYLVKGKRIAVAGRLRQERWSQDGENRSKIAVVADAIQLLDGASGGDSASARKRESAPQPSSAAFEGYGIPF
jgi:single-strand DNA-binding protein